MPRGKRGSGGGAGKQAEAYTHEEATRKNIPEAGLVDYLPADLPTADEQKPEASESPYRAARKGPGKYCWDPRESPQLVWAAKAGLKKVEVEEETSIEVPLVNLHIHERVATSSILRSTQRHEALPCGKLRRHHAEPS